MEASAPHESRDYERRVEERQPTGWAVFAGVLLFIVGSLDALWGWPESSTTKSSSSADRV